MGDRVTVGVSMKTYFGNSAAASWFEAVAELAAGSSALAAGEIELFVAPTYLQVHAATRAFRGTPVLVGAQDVAAHGPGPYTGEVSAAELAEVGVRLAEVGHAERRRLFGETDEVVATKVAIALRHGLTPVLCVGELGVGGAEEAAADCLLQLHAALAGAPSGRVIVAYEPVWAIGAQHAAPLDHITTVCTRLRIALAELPDRPDSSVIYGGSAAPGLLTALGASSDGVFLGRFAHDPEQLGRVLAEAEAVVRSRRRSGAASR
jgi:triosephosphate isomerase